MCTAYLLPRKVSLNAGYFWWFSKCFLHPCVVVGKCTMCTLPGVGWVPASPCGGGNATDNSGSVCQQMCLLLSVTHLPALCSSHPEGTPVRPPSPRRNPCTRKVSPVRTLPTRMSPTDVPPSKGPPWQEYPTYKVSHRKTHDKNAHPQEFSPMQEDPSTQFDAL